MENRNKLFSGVAILGALSASICCIGPFIALAISGSSFASLFSWAAPFRPILIGPTIMILIYAWQRKLRMSKPADCDCENQKKPKFSDTKLFLGILTGVAILFMTFPYYSTFLPFDTGKKLQASNTTNQSIAKFYVSGMTCESCAKSIKNSLEAKNGVESVTILLAENLVLVTFNPKVLTSKQVSEHLSGMGYPVLSDATAKNWYEYHFTVHFNLPALWHSKRRNYAHRCLPVFL